MGKIIMECPRCGVYQEVVTGLFKKKSYVCQCGKWIDTEKEMMEMKECKHCGNVFVYDSMKNKSPKCPVCNELLNDEEEKYKYVFFNCPSCSCKLQVKKEVKTYACPLCEETIDVRNLIEKNKLISNNSNLIIKYEGDCDTVVWKHPIENFNFGTELIVGESQMAIFMKDGRIADCFSVGRYTLDIEKFPGLRNQYLNESECFSKIYFINMLSQNGIKWGTDSKVRMFDPASGLSLELGAYGEFGFKVMDAKKMFIDLIGSTSDYEGKPYVSDVKMIVNKFKNMIIAKAKGLLVKSIKENGINILEVDERLIDLSMPIKKEIDKMLSEYGIQITDFSILKVVTPDDDPNFKRMKEQYAEQYLLVKEEQIKKNVAMANQQTRIVEAQSEAQEEIIAAQAKAEAYRLQAQAEAQEMKMKGYTYQDETKRMVSYEAAKNTNIFGIGDLNIPNMSIDPLKVPGLEEDLHETKGTNLWICPSCGKKDISSMFCPDCGTKKPVDKTTWICPNCGKTDITTMFCPDCGTKKAQDETWNCSCGERNIKSNFCPSCGKKKNG